MKTTINGLLGIGMFLSALLVDFPAFSQEVLRLTLEESLEYALENNVDAKNSKLEVLRAKASITERTAAGLPQITGSFDVTHNAAIPVVFLPNEGPFQNPDLDLDVLPVRFGVNYTSGLVFQLNQMIFDGSYFVGLKAAKTYKLLSEFDNQKAQVDVKETVKKAYFSVLVNDVRQNLVTANLNRLDTLLKETQALYDAGFAEKIDVTRIKVQRNNLQTEIDRIKAARDISVELLKLQMGLPLNYKVELSESLRDLVSLNDLMEILTMEGGRRVEIDQLETNINLVDLDIKYTTSLYIPNLDFFGTYQRNAAAQSTGLMFQSDRWFTGAFVGLRLQIPIFDGLLKSGQIRQKRYQLEQLQNQRVFFEDNIAVERFQARTNLKNSISAFKAQEENRELALEVFRMAQIKYQEGVGSNLEVVEADSALKDAENNYFSALYDALIAKVDLEKALGIL